MKKIVFSSALAATLLMSVAYAHEHQIIQIGNKDYTFVVGSLNEPIIVDDKTGVDLRVQLNGKPVEGLDKDVKVEISAGDKKKTLDLSPVYNIPGSYKAIFFPTIQTTYSYRFFGKINNTPVDLTFTCNPAGHPMTEEDTEKVNLSDGVIRKEKEGAFGCPTAKADYGFPEKSVSLIELEGNWPSTAWIAVFFAGLTSLIWAFRRK